MKKCKNEECISFFTQRNCGAWFQTTNFSPLHMSRWPPTSHTATKFCLFTTSLLHSSWEAAKNHPVLNKEQADFVAHPWGLGTRERILSVQGWRWLSGTHGLLSPCCIWHDHNNLCSFRAPELPPTAPKEGAKEAWMVTGTCWLDYLITSETQHSTALVFSVGLQSPWTPHNPENPGVQFCFTLV